MFISEKEKTMYNAFEKNVKVVDTKGNTHKTRCVMFTSRYDEVNGISSIALSDGTWLYENQIESLEILDQNEK